MIQSQFQRDETFIAWVGMKLGTKLTRKKKTTADHTTLLGNAHKLHGTKGFVAGESQVIDFISFAKYTVSCLANIHCNFRFSDGFKTISLQPGLYVSSFMFSSSVCFYDVCAALAS
jgi:hypothetical protein